MRYSLTQTTEPAAEPITLARAKKHLAIGHDDDDAEIAARIKAARRYCETHTGRIFGERTFTVKFQEWPSDGEIPLPVDPVSGIEEIRYTDSEGDSQVVDVADYRTWLDRSPPIVRFTSAFIYPAFDLDEPAPLEVDFTAGEVAPEEVATAIELTLEYWYSYPGGLPTLDHLSRGLPSGAIRLLDSLWTGAL